MGEQLELVNQLNGICEDQTGGEAVILAPFRYISSGDRWSIEFLGWPVADDDEQGSMTPQELKNYVIEEVNKYLESIRKLKL